MFFMGLKGFKYPTLYLSYYQTQKHEMEPSTKLQGNSFLTRLVLFQWNGTNFGSPFQRNGTLM